VEYIFWKELFCALGIVVAFQFINFSYLDLFRRDGFDHLSSENAKVKYLKHQISIYNGFNFIGSLFAAAMFYSVI